MTAAPPPAPPSFDPPSYGPPPIPDPPSWGPPPPAGPPQRPPLRRSTTDRMLGGVSGGLAEYSGVDALLWRVGFVALTVAGGTGVVVYLLLWLLMPAGHGDGPGRRVRGRAARPPAGPRSAVPGVTLAAALIIVGTLVLVSRLTGWDPGVRAVLGSALLVVGGGLVASAFLGGRHARGGLITLGLALSAALAIASTGPWDRFRSGVGDRSYSPLTAAAVKTTYDAGIGNTTVDLTRVDLAGAPTPIRTHVDGGVGNLHVLVPASADVQVSLDEGMGRADILGNGATDGFYGGSGTEPWAGDGQPEFVISINAGIGNVEVDRG